MSSCAEADERFSVDASDFCCIGIAEKEPLSCVLNRAWQEREAVGPRIPSARRWASCCHTQLRQSRPGLGCAPGLVLPGSVLSLAEISWARLMFSGSAFWN